MDSAAKANGEGQKMVDIYWLGRSDLGFLECEVAGTQARWAHGAWRPIVYCHSEGHWVWR